MVTGSMDTPDVKLVLEDLHIGQTFRSGTYQLKIEEMKEFARQYDPQPFHTDEEAAQNSFFQGLAGSGWHTAAVTMRLLVSSMPIKGGLIGAGGEIAWTRPTRPGDTLEVESEILEINPARTRPDHGMVTVRSITRNQDGKTVQTVVCKLVVPKGQAV